MRHTDVRLRRWGPSARAAALGIAFAALVAGCVNHPHPAASTAAPPWRVCGHTLYSAPAGPVFVNTWRWPSTRPITHLSAGNALYLRFTRHCTGGVEVEFRPHSAATISKAVDGEHGLLGAIVEPRRNRFDIRIVRGDPATQVLRVRLR